MKTIAEISRECGVHRTTLNKAIERGDIPAELRGKTYLIDDESPLFKAWLDGYNTGRPRGERTMSHPETIIVETPEPPRWVNTDAARRAWNENLAWRVNASSALGIGAKQTRKTLLKEAEQMYGTR